MDDICDSVSTTEEARDLTRDIDSVLETGGFRVKGWVSNRAETLIDIKMTHKKHFPIL